MFHVQNCKGQDIYTCDLRYAEKKKKKKKYNFRQCLQSAKLTEGFSRKNTFEVVPAFRIRTKRLMSMSHYYSMTIHYVSISIAVAPPSISKNYQSLPSKHDTL